MLGYQSGKLLLIASVIGLTSETVSAQTFVRQAQHQDKQVGQPWCGLQGCPPKQLTYGFFEENWRRWPSESLLTDGDDLLKPFVTPDRSIPDSVLPDPRDEATEVQRERKPVRTPGMGLTPTPRPGPTTDPGPATDPAPLAPSTNFDSSLPNDLMDESDESGGIFPSGDLPDESVREAFPSGDLPADDLLDSGLPGEDEDLFNPDADDSNDLQDESEIELPGDDDGYDLDLGLKGPSREHAQVTPRELQSPARALRQIDLVSAQSLADEVHVHIRTATNRRNPLRRSVKARYAIQRKPTARQQSPPRQRPQSVAPASYSKPAPPAPSRERVTSGARRANPLR